jgi:hypothetical protein
LSRGTISGKTNADASDAIHNRANMATIELVEEKARYEIGTELRVSQEACSLW